MSYQQKLDSASALIMSHNNILGEGHPGLIDPAEFIQNVKITGATNEDLLKSLSHEDILKCMLMPGWKQPVTPVILAKEIAKIFREKDNGNTDEKKYVSKRRIETMSTHDLLETYDASEPNSVVGQRLNSIAKGEPFIVFDSGKTLDVENSKKLLNEIKDGFPGRQYIEIKGQTKQIYRIGELPDQYVEENPLYPTRPLRPDGTCDQTGRSWAGVPLDVRQFVYLAVKLGEISVTVPNGLMVANSAISIVLGDNAIENLKKNFGLPKTSIEFAKRSKTDELPKLRLVLPKNKVSSNGPFGAGKNVSETCIGQPNAPFFHK